MRKLLFLSILVWLAGCTREASQFDGRQAFQYLEQQCQMGPRNPGSVGHSAAKDYFVSFFTPLADTNFCQEFDQFIAYDSVTFQMSNIIAGFAMEKGNPLLLGAHWDTRPWADHDPDPAKRNQPITGANDGASGCAVLMHLAEYLSQNPPDRAVYIVLFDGEDYGTTENFRSYCLGSAYFAQNLPIEKPVAAIILDMIGDADLKIPVERNSYRSNPGLIKQIWDIARKRGYKQFVHQLDGEIYDDHLMLIEYAKIPAIDIIDFEYPNRFSNYWHTTKDTPDKCSPKSLQVVGQVIIDYLYTSAETN